MPNTEFRANIWSVYLAMAFVAFLQITRKTIESRMGSKFSKIRPVTVQLKDGTRAGVRAWIRPFSLSNINMANGN